MPAGPLGLKARGAPSDAREVKALALAAVVLASALLAGAGRADASVRRVPAWIASDCSADVSGALNAWIGSVPDRSRIRFRKRACYRVERTLELTDRHDLDIDGRGATFRATTAGDIWRSQWRIVGGSGLRLRNMTVRGTKAAGGGFAPALQHQHSFELLGARNVAIDRARASDAPGDCVYIGQGREAPWWSRDIRVRRLTCARTGRMGIAVVAAQRVLVQRSTFRGIARTAFDVEPRGAGFGARDITFSENRVTGPLPGGFLSAIGDQPIDGLRVLGNRMSGAGMYLAVLAAPGRRHSGITVAGNSADVGYSAPGSAAFDFEGVQGLRVTGNRIRLSGANMALAWVLDSCGVRISGNRFPGGVVQARVVPASCPPAAVRR
jgi:hypothetical protein